LMSRTYSNRLLVQTRKSWNFMIFYLIISLFIPFVNSFQGLTHWVLAVVPISLFHAAFYFYPKKKTFPELIFWLSLIWIIANYAILNS
jgi:4-hydroxybenzoate polyprenyltransferase